MFKRVLSLTLLLFVSLAVAGLIGEAVIRLTIKDRIVLFPRYHTDATYGEFRIRRFRPNLKFWHTSVDGTWQFETNDKGFRNQENYSYERNNDKLRIMSIGDSHTAGYEVAQNETYSAVLEAMLIKHGIDAEVINTGISGFGTAEELVFFENEGLRYSPDIVILGFYANDMQDSVKAGLFSLQENSLKLEKKDHLPGVGIQNLLNSLVVVRWLSENSYFFSFTFNSVYEIAKAALNAAAKKKAQTEYAIPVGDFTDYEYALTAALIHRLFQLCQDNDIELIMLDIPTPTNIKQIRSSIPGSLRRSFMNDSNILIDSRIVLSPLITKSIPVHVEHGHRHISAESHRLFAEALFSAIQSNLRVHRELDDL